MPKRSKKDIKKELLLVKENKLGSGVFEISNNNYSNEYYLDPPVIILEKVYKDKTPTNLQLFKKNNNTFVSYIDGVKLGKPLQMII